MIKIIESFFEEFLLIEVVEDESAKEHLLVKDILGEDFIYIIECNLNIFVNIPKTDLENVFEEFFYILMEYKRETKLHQIGFYKKDLKKTSIKIKTDIKIIEKYQKMLEKSFGILRLKDRTRPSAFIGTPDYIKELYNNNLRLLNDLKNDNHNITYKYQNIPKPNKNSIKQFLQKIRKKYNLKTSIDEKQLIDSL